MQQLSERLFADYNFYRRHCRNMAAVERSKGYMPPDLQPKGEYLQGMQAMATWCVERKIDPFLWLYTLFTARVWMYPPRFHQLTPARHIPRYEKASRLGFYERRQRSTRAKAKEKRGETYDPNRDVSASVESIKAQYSRNHDSDSCMSATREETLGFHPASAICGECPQKQPCAEQLRSMVPFDILALRHGMITAEQAQLDANRYWQEQLADPMVAERFPNAAG